MVANPDFYLGTPKLNEVIYKILPDENTAVTQLQTHEIDMVALGTGINWPRVRGAGRRSEERLIATRVDSFIFAHVDFNLRIRS